MTTPEPTPADKALKRVLAVSRLNGWSVAIFAALCVLVALGMGDLLGIAICLLVLVSGWMEIRGNRLIKQRDPAGMKWLVRSQMFLLAVILAYCARCLGSFDSDSVMSNLTPDMEAVLKEAGIEKADLVPLVHKMFFVLYGAVALTCLIYQGGLALFYRGKTALVTEALTRPPVRVPVLPPSI
jgi:hypothetical protein